MSRSAPTKNNPNPSTRFFEWKGSDGTLVWYDKENKTNVTVPNGFRFLVLDQLNTVTGYNKKAKSGIYSNEVRDAAQDVLIVKMFNGEEVATGFWTSIKDRVTVKQGKFAKSVYIAFKDGDELKIGNIRFSGCSLGPWFDFTKKHRKEVDTMAIVIKAGKQDTSGSVDFTPPVFSVVEVNEETNAKAIELDKTLQEFLTGYLGKAKTEQVASEHVPEDTTNYARREPDPDLDPVDEDTVPF